MCGYCGHEFGALYPDSVCIDGRLWNADSEDDGRLTQGGELACPACNTCDMLASALEDARDGSCGCAMGVPYCPATAWDGACAAALSANRAEAEAFIRSVMPFPIADWPDREAVMAGRAPWDVTVERLWTPSVALSAD